jgi:hypothetical protein
VTKLRLIQLLIFAAMVASLLGKHHPGFGFAWGAD